MEKITVVVPVYNACHTLDRCVSSLLAQRPCEIWLIDDGSTDGSGGLCDALAADNPAIRVLHQPNAGVSAARNAGLRLATGEWVTFVDSDDVLLPGALNALLEAAGDADAVCGGVRRGTDATPARGSTRRFQTPDELHTALRLALEDPTRYLTCHGWLLRAECTRDFSFRTDLRYGEDGELLLRVLTRCRGIVECGSDVYGYTIQKSSALHGFHPETQGEYLRTLDAVERELADRPELRPSVALYELSHLLLILTHGTFHPANPAAVRDTWRAARALLDLPRFQKAFADAPLTRLGAAKRAVLLLLKHGCVTAAWACVRLRQAHNARRAEGEGGTNP